MNQNPPTLQSFTLPEPVELYTREQVWQAIDNYLTCAIKDGRLVTQQKHNRLMFELQDQLEDLQNVIKAVANNKNLVQLGLPRNLLNLPLVRLLEEKIAP